MAKETQNDTNKNPFAMMEEEVLEFWKKSETFKQSVEKEAPKGDYIFYDGPPFITGLPHYATLLPSIAKDMVPRFWTMKGYRVLRKWGWDCHGLPAENQVEKQLGLKNKQDIENLGVDKFVSACRDYVNVGSEQWQWYIERIARWVDMEHAYRTMDLDFMESVIWAFKALYDKGMIYEGYRSSLHCPRCATPLSKFEITMDAGSYRDVTEESVVVKFKLITHNLELITGSNVYILAWTTTPWTLPGNLALAVNESIKYQVLSIKGSEEKFIIAEERVSEIFKDKEYEVIGDILGKDLVGLGYEPLFDLKNKEIRNNQNVFKIYAADYVSTEDGTGVVHIAPNFGEDDFNLGKKHQLPMVELMNEMGHYTEVAGEWSGLYFKKAGARVMEIIGDKLFSRFSHTHSYPFCYRCDTPLIYKTQKAWYLKVDDVRQKMIKLNENINWMPEHFKEGRFKYNLENAPDWCLSRSRYWGSPIPVWKCEACGEIKVAGSIAEIENLSGKKVKDLHRPAIDQIEFKCQCQGRMKRVKEVMDCWFESGSMPFGQFHYPFAGQNAHALHPDFPFPSDFIIEYTGQLRGWFYYLHVLSTALFGNLAFKNVIVSGVLAGTDGRKMSKSFGNYPDPKATLDKYGADALRIYFMSGAIMSGDDATLNEKDIQDALRKNVMLLWNVAKFYEMFSANSKFDYNCEPKEIDNILDKWIISKLNELITETTEGMEKYDLPKASRPITAFIDDLSTWYLRRSRDRFKSEKESERTAAIAMTGYVLATLAKVIAPVMPFIAEQVWQKVTGFNFKDEGKSVHLESWPKAGMVDKKIMEEMEATRKVVEIALAKRDEAQIKVRQPLASIIVRSPKTVAIKNAYIELIKDEVNVKTVEFKGTGDEIDVQLNTELTEELKQEGMKREIVRFINNQRKNAGLTIDDRIVIFWEGSDQIKKVIMMFREELLKDTLSEEIKEGIGDDVNFQKTADINGEEVIFGIVKK